MKQTVLTSKDNPAVKNTAKLISSSAARAEQGLFVLEGARLCEDAALSGYSILSVFCTEKALSAYSDRLAPLLEGAEKVYTVSEQVFSKLCDTASPQGVLAVVRTPAVKDALFEGVWLALQNIQDPANLGAMARTAEALGVSGILVSAGSCDPYSPKAQRSAMGSLLRLPVIKCDDLLSTLAALKSRGLELVAAVVRDADHALGERPFSKNSVIMIGNEGNGLTADAICLADRKITIDMKGRNESLNAAAAATLFMWEATKER